MKELIVDKQQFIGEVKERNRFYKALTEIKSLSAQAGNQALTAEKLLGILKKITALCEETLKAAETQPQQK